MIAKPPAFKKCELIASLCIAQSSLTGHIIPLPYSAISYSYCCALQRALRSKLGVVGNLNGVKPNEGVV